MTDTVLNISSLVLYVSKYMSYHDFNVQFASVSKTQHLMMKEKIFMSKKIKIQKLIVKQYEYYARTNKYALIFTKGVPSTLHPFEVRTVNSYNMAVKRLMEYERVCEK